MRTALTIPAVSFIVIFALANWRHGLHDGRWEEGLRMAQRLVIIGRYDEAEQWVEKLEPQAPRPGLAHQGVGMQYLVENQTSQAIAHLTRALEIDPNQPLVQYTLGQALLKADRAKDAVPHLARGFDAGIEIPLGGFDLALALRDAGDPQRAADVIRHQHLVRRVPVPDHIYLYAARLVRKTRPNGATAPAWLKPLVAWGAGPRAVQYLILGAKARAALLGSYMVRLEDVIQVAAPVLTHRIITTFAAQAEGIDAKQIVRRLVEETEASA